MLVQRNKTHLKYDEGLWEGHVTLLHNQQSTCKCNKTHRTLTHSNKVGSLGYIVKYIKLSLTTYVLCEVQYFTLPHTFRLDPGRMVGIQVNPGRMVGIW